MNKLPNNIKNIYDLSYKTLLDLASDEGITASSRNEAYGCIFGRDSAITILKILRVQNLNPNLGFLEACRTTLKTLVDLQGKKVNIESGEEPGKILHEYRKDNYERLINRPRPWYVYPDGVIKNYDSLDSTPLTLLAIYKYSQVASDNDFLHEVLPNVKKGLEWIINYGDKNGDYLVDYELPTDRISGGLVVQSWSDSANSLLQEDGSFPEYPIAPVEVQGICFLTLKIWADYFDKIDRDFAEQLRLHAGKMKKQFNQTFIYKEGEFYFAAQALDGKKNQIKTVTSNPLLLLWATYNGKGRKECILEERYIPDIVMRAMMPDMFEKDAGIRTMSTLSKTFNPKTNSYHNGSFWPMINGLIHEGFMNWGYLREARMVYQATLQPIEYFNSPIELFIKSEDGKFQEYQSDSGKLGCRYQAWTAAILLDMIAHNDSEQVFENRPYQPDVLTASS